MEKKSVKICEKMYSVLTTLRCDEMCHARKQSRLAMSMLFLVNSAWQCLSQLVIFISLRNVTLPSLAQSKSETRIEGPIRSLQGSYLVAALQRSSLRSQSCFKMDPIIGRNIQPGSWQLCSN